MHLKRLVLTEFRNYAQLQWEPGSRLAILTGENGAGKTNLLEAVSLLAPGRGLRGAALMQVARQGGAPSWGVVAHIERGADRVTIATGSDPTGGPRRVFRLDGEAIRAQAAIAAQFACVWLTPQMDRLLTDSPAGRRRFLDRLVVALDPAHGREVAAHDRALAQRNRLLATHVRDGKWFEAVEDSLARHAVAVTAGRLALIDDLNAQTVISGDFPAVSLSLGCPIARDLDQMSALAAEDRLRAVLASDRGGQGAPGVTGYGAHRADLIVSECQTGRLASMASSGQQKAMLLALILSHAALIEVRRGEPPVLLLDEPLIHLDEKRRSALLDLLKAPSAPVLLTGTDPEQFDPLNGHAQRFTVESGHLRPEPCS